MTVPPRTIARMRWLRHLRPLLGLAPVQLPQGQVEAGTWGPVRSAAPRPVAMSGVKWATRAATRPGSP